MRFLSLAGLLFGLCGCSNFNGITSDASCDSSSASEVTLQIVRDQIVKVASNVDADSPSLSKSKIRASVRDLKLSLVDVRTTKNDPNSSKKFCTGTLRLVAPAQMVLDADEARQSTGLNSVEDLADSVNVTKDANAFTADIDFNVQPTDDGEKIFAEIENGSETVHLFAELVQASLLRSAIADAQAASNRAAAEQQAELDAANREMEQATLEEAKASNNAAVGAINAIWKAIPAEARQQMLPAQRAWIKKTAAACKIEAAGQEGNAEVARLNCETREQNSRAQYLRNFATEAINSEYSGM